jgi:hypothetical protein
MEKRRAGGRLFFDTRFPPGRAWPSLSGRRPGRRPQAQPRAFEPKVTVGFLCVVAMYRVEIGTRARFWLAVEISLK